MTDTTTSPSGTVDSAPMSFDEGVNAIAGLLDDVPAEQDHIEAEKATTSETNPEEAGTVIEGEEDLVLDDVELDDVADATVEAPPVTASDDLEVELEDGQKISLGELKRNNLFQRDYTRKTEELKQQREQLQTEHQKRVSEAEAEISSQRDFILNYAQRFMPRQPDPAMMDETSPGYDPIGYLHAQRQYEQEVQQFNAIVQQREQQTAAERQQQERDRKATIAEEQAKLFEKMPKLKDEKARAAFYKEAVEIGTSTYGIAPEEIGQIGDHRYMRILHDAIQYRKAVAKAGSVQKQVSAKPKLVQQQRMAPQAVQARDREGKFQALRESGSIDDAARAIETFL
jgi:hypothetical protein